MADAPAFSNLFFGDAWRTFGRSGKPKFGPILDHFLAFRVRFCEVEPLCEVRGSVTNLVTQIKSPKLQQKLGTFYIEDDFLNYWLVLRRRILATPIAPRPANSIATVEGSGVGVTVIAERSSWLVEAEP